MDWICITGYLGWGALLLTPVALCINAAVRDQQTGKLIWRDPEMQRKENFRKWGPGSGRFWPPL